MYGVLDSKNKMYKHFHILAMKPHLKNERKETKLHCTHCMYIDTVLCVRGEFSIFRSSPCAKFNYILKKIPV